jgi:hypothetical protein
MPALVWDDDLEPRGALRMPQLMMDDGLPLDALSASILLVWTGRMRFAMSNSGVGRGCPR